MFPPRDVVGHDVFPEAGPQRLVELDIFRGVALVFMIVIHNMFTWTPLRLREWPGFWAIGDIYFGMAASLFFAASGAAAYVSIGRRFQVAGASRRHLVLRVSTRSALLYAVGIAFEQVYLPPPYDVTFFAELNTIATISLLALLFTLYKLKTRTLLIIASGAVSGFFFLRYVLILVPVAYGTYSLTPFWSNAPTVQFSTNHPLPKLAVEFAYSFSIWGSFGIFGMVFAKWVLEKRITSRFLYSGLFLMFAGYFVQFHLKMPIQKWPMSLSYFFLATGVTVAIFFASGRLVSWTLPSFPESLAAVGKYTLPIYFGHYLAIFFSEVSGAAEVVRASDTNGFLVSSLLVAIVTVFLSLAYFANRWNLKIPRKDVPSNPWTRSGVAPLIAFAIITYVVYAEPFYLALGMPGADNRYYFLSFDVTMTLAWYVAYRQMG